MGRRYVEVPSDRLVAELEEIAARVQERGGSAVWGVKGRERTLDLQPASSPARVWLYTSLAAGAGAVRDCGEDAVRIVVGYVAEPETAGDPDEVRRFRPLEGGVRLYRTAPAKGDRVGAFLERLRGALREAYGRALQVPRCPECRRPMTERKGRRGAFLGCTGYPKCQATRPLPGRAS